MFQVKSIANNSRLKENKIYDVYSVKKVSLDTLFLIYGENKMWHWSLAECFVPLEDSMDENWWD